MGYAQNVVACLQSTGGRENGGSEDDCPSSGCFGGIPQDLMFLLGFNADCYWVEGDTLTVIEHWTNHNSGCTDSIADNFDSSAFVDDSSCVYNTPMATDASQLASTNGGGSGGGARTVDQAGAQTAIALGAVVVAAAIGGVLRTRHGRLRSVILKTGTNVLTEDQLVAETIL